MNLTPEKNEKKTAEKPSIRGELRLLPRRLWRLLRHNLLWKLMAVALAVSLWAGLITQDPSLTRERVFTDVPVTVMGEETLQRNGMVVLTDFDNEPLAVRLRADVPQREYSTVSASNFNPRIDLTKITKTGPQTLRILTTSTTTYGTVKEVTPESLDVIVEKYDTNYRVPVVIRRTGQFPKGFYGSAAALDPSTVSVSGPESIVDQIARVVVDFDVSRLTPQAGLSRTASLMRFEDIDGNPVDGDLIDVTSAGVLLRSIVVEQTLYTTKTLPLSSLALTSGQPAAGYEVRSVTATPNVLVAAGDEVGLSALDSLFLEQSVDVTDKTESFSVEVRIRKPSELVYLSAESVTLYVEIAPVISSRDFSDIPLHFQDKSGVRSVDCPLTSVFVTLTGPQTLLNQLKPAALSAYVDVSDLLAGSYEQPILLKIDGVDEKQFSYRITPTNAQLQVTLP